MNAQKRITLTKTGLGWLATFHGDAQVKAAFGTVTIPTAYTAKASAATVQAGIAALNPACDVQIDEESR